MIALVLLAAALPIAQTRHNLSVTGPGATKSGSESQICVFCHVPHRGLGLGLNRPLSTASYQPYASTTMVAPPPGQPNGATRICLSCHDGTIALGATLASGTIPVTTGTPGGTLSGSADLGTDLRGSHPVSFTPVATPAVRAPPPGDPCKLDAQGRVQCTSCHDPHQDGLDPVQGKFLVKPNRASALCLTCHLSASWASNPSAHQASTAFYDASLGATTPWTTVADNACESCHRPHAGSTSGRLLKDLPSRVCLQCHAGRVARLDISADLAKQFSHPVLSSDGTVHDAAEAPDNAAATLPETRPSAPRHAECADCHEPHAAFHQTATAPRASGALSFTWGIDRTGARIGAVQNEYEVCFKCHGDSANQPPSPAPPETVQREVTDLNLRRVFDSTAPSFHPVEGPGRSVSVPGLIAPLTAASVIYCSDCHASDTGPGAGGSGPAGPHGSIWPHILERNLSTADHTPEGPAAYALCYKCHDRGTLLSAASNFSRHTSHVQADGGPCSACHDWHGVSALQGNASNNAHLVNFDVSIVKPNAKGVRRYTSGGLGHGTCSLACHGIDHDAAAY